ncbi:hypothetical protein SFUMM280S_10892 [Streptomyces fumanus]
MLSENPGQFLDGTGRVLQGQRAAKGLLARLARTQQDLKTYAADASAQWTRLEANRKAKAAARKRTEQRIAAAEKLESALEKEEKERLAALERQAAEEGAERLAGHRRPGQGRRPGHRAGREGRGVRHRADRQAVRVGRRGPEVLRLLRGSPPRRGRRPAGASRAPRRSSGGNCRTSAPGSCGPAT